MEDAILAGLVNQLLSRGKALGRVRFACGDSRNCLLVQRLYRRADTYVPRVIRALGMGLDEKAIEAVMKYKFKPGMKGGKPVAVWQRISVDFHLY